jgi:hypothetical protein
VCDESTLQLTSVDMPVISQVTQASPEKPILALILKLDMASVREILSQEEFVPTDVSAGTRGMAIGKSTPELLSSCIRLLDLLDTLRDIPFLAGLMQREIVYRLLRSPLGKHSSAELVAGWIAEGEVLLLESSMPSGGCIFSDGIEADSVEFNAGAIVRVHRAKERARLVLP